MGRYLLGVLVLAGAYFATGKLGLLLAIPPGYATTIWPPSGIAVAGLLILGVRSWPGIAVGSFLVNASVASGDGAEALPPALVIALGAALQAIVAARLIRRFVGYPTALAQQRDVGKFLLLAGPVASSVNATIGPLALGVATRVNWSDYAVNWVTWWAGDALGVAMIAPIILAFFGQPARVWRPRRLTTGAPLAAVFALAIVASVDARHYERGQIQARLDDQGDRVADTTLRDLQVFVEAAQGLAGFMSASPDATRHQFRDFVASSRQVQPWIVAMEWIPRVPWALRSQYESGDAAASQPVPFSELSQTGARRGAGVRSEYFPVYFAEPLAANREAIGLDLSSEPIQREALFRARDSGAAALTGGIRLVQDRDATGVRIFVPVYATPVVPESLEDRRRLLRGFAVGVARVADIIAATNAHVDATGLVLELRDELSGGRGDLLYRSFGAGRRNEPVVVRTQVPVAIAGRQWTIVLEAGPQFLAIARTGHIWTVLGASLFGAAFVVGALLLAVTGRADVVEQLVRERTGQLERANQSLAKSEEKFRALLEAAPDAIVISDAAGSIVLVNALAETTFGYSRRELVGAQVKQLLPDVFPDAPVHPAAAGPAGAGLEVTGVRKDGNEIPVEITSSPIETHEGLLITSSIRDISERKRGERMLELLRRVAVAANSATTVDEALASCLEEICAFAPCPAGYVYQVQHPDWPRSAIISCIRPGQCGEHNGRVVTALARRATATLEQVVDDGRPLCTALEVAGEGSDPAKSWTLLAVPVLVGEEVSHVLAFLRPGADADDPGLLQVAEPIGVQLGRVVERARAHDHRVYSEALERSNRELKLFAHVASHDLREPLRMVKSFLELLKDRYHDALDERANRYISNAVGGAARMQELIQSLHQYSRVDTRAMQWGLVDMNVAIDKSLANLRESIRESGAVISKDDRFPTVWGDEAQLVQLFQNLIDNAIKFCRDHRPEVQISARRRGTQWEFTVSDNGIGIDMNFADRIFRVFERLHLREEYPGTGMGLAICKRISERHGGKIWLKSTPGIGTVFSVLLSTSLEESEHESKHTAARDSLG